MRRVRPVSAVALCAASLCAASGCGGSNERPSIVEAVRAPVVAFKSRNASMLCQSFTPSVAKKLIEGDSDCVSGASRAFADISGPGQEEIWKRDEEPRGLKIEVLGVHGGLASVRTTWPTWREGAPSTVRLTLALSDGRWRIMTTTKMMNYLNCAQGMGEGKSECDTGHGIEFGTGPSTVRLNQPEEPPAAIPARARTPHASPHYELAFSPPVTGGAVGWCVNYRTPHESSGVCPGTAAAVNPIYEAGWASAAPPPVTSGFVLTTSAVAAISVNGSPRIPTRADPAIPDGLRGVLVEFASPGRRLRDLSPRVVPLGSRGRPIGQTEGSLTGSGFGLNGVFWQRPSRAPHGACELSGTHLPGLTAEWGHVAAKLRSFANLLPPALMSCDDTEYYLDNWPLDAAVVLNAAHPGAPPEPLYDFKSVPGLAGVVESPSASQVARRAGGAWILVEGGSGLRQRLTVLAHLQASVHL
jgi:hypothetical protein